MGAESVRVTPRLPIEGVACRAYLSADQDNLNGDEWNKVNFDAVTYDLGSNFDIVTNHRFDVPVTGLYSINAIVRLEGDSVIADKRYLIDIYVNNVAVAQTSSHSSLVNTLSLVISDERYLEKDDYVEIFVYPNVGAATDTVDISGITTGVETYFVIRLTTKKGSKQ